MQSQTQSTVSKRKPSKPTPKALAFQEFQAAKKTVPALSEMEMTQDAHGYRVGRWSGNGKFETRALFSYPAGVLVWLDRCKRTGRVVVPTAWESYIRSVAEQAAPEAEPVKLTPAPTATNRETLSLDSKMLDEALNLSVHTSKLLVAYLDIRPIDNEAIAECTKAREAYYAAVLDEMYSYRALLRSRITVNL